MESETMPRLIDQAGVEALIDTKINACAERRERLPANADLFVLADLAARISAMNSVKGHLKFIEPAFETSLRNLKESGYNIVNTGYINMLIVRGPDTMIREIDRLTNKIIALQCLCKEGKLSLHGESRDILFK